MNTAELQKLTPELERAAHPALEAGSPARMPSHGPLVTAGEVAEGPALRWHTGEHMVTLGAWCLEASSAGVRVGAEYLTDVDRAWVADALTAYRLLRERRTEATEEAAAMANYPPPGKAVVPAQREAGQ